MCSRQTRRSILMTAGLALVVGYGSTPLVAQEGATKKSGAASTAKTSPAAKTKSPSPATTQSPDAGKKTATAKAAPTGPKPALDGYSPVSYFASGKPVKGKPEFKSKYVGEIYYFESAEAKAKFDKDPDKYLPQYGGMGTMALGGPYGNRLWGDPTVFDIRNGKLYLFWNERAKRSYEKHPDACIQYANERFTKPAMGGHCPVAYQLSNEAVEAPPILRTVYRGWLYFSRNEESYEKFRADPARFAPQYRGYCAEGVSRNKRFPADSTQFIVRDNKTYLFFDAKAKLEFSARSAELIKKADANWVELSKKLPL